MWDNSSTGSDVSGASDVSEVSDADAAVSELFPSDCHGEPETTLDSETEEYPLYVPAELSEDVTSPELLSLLDIMTD